jgi:hypothetical protein
VCVVRLCVWVLPCPVLCCVLCCATVCVCRSEMSSDRNLRACVLRIVFCVCHTFWALRMLIYHNSRISSLQAIDSFAPCGLSRLARAALWPDAVERIAGEEGRRTHMCASAQHVRLLITAAPSRPAESLPSTRVPLYSSTAPSVYRVGSTCQQHTFRTRTS